MWETSLAFWTLTRSLRTLLIMSVLQVTGVSVVPIKTIDKEKEILYDASVFGTSRRVMMKSSSWQTWLGCSNDTGEVVGFNTFRPTIIGKETEFALTIAPFFTDNYDIAKALLKTAAKECFTNDAIPVSNFEMFFRLEGRLVHKLLALWLKWKLHVPPLLSAHVCTQREFPREGRSIKSIA